MAQTTHIPYGAFELKRYYQRNMLLGSAFSASLTLFCILSVWLYNVITYEEMEARNVRFITSAKDLGVPPSLAAKPPQIDIAKPEMAMPKVGIPTPVADEEVVDENVMMATKEELQEITAPAVTATNDGSQDLVIDIPEEDYLPPADTFIAYEVEPVQINEVIAEYPRLAQDGGFTAYVIIQAYVGKDGVVKKAQAVKCSRPGMGFEEAAIKAAYKVQWRPAVQNGNPVAVWVAYKYDFILGN